MADANGTLEIVIEPHAFYQDKKMFRLSLRQAGQKVAATARQLVRSGSRSGLKYGPRAASAPGEPPASRTGQLARSIKVKVGRSGESVSVRDTAFYALFLEGGAKGGGKEGTRNKKGRAATRRVLEPRPFLSTALRQDEADISVRLYDALANGISFRPAKKGKI